MSLAEFDVTGQKVLVVGAGRGIGKGIALAFAEAGADVAIASLTEGTVGKVAEEIRALGRSALPVTGDATKAADMDRITDDAAWKIREDWPMDDSWSLWGDKDQPEVFFRPDDIDQVIEGWHKAHG